MNELHGLDHLSDLIASALALADRHDVGLVGIRLDQARLALENHHAPHDKARGAASPTSRPGFGGLALVLD
jgi:hypothetical protein